MATEATRALMEAELAGKLALLPGGVGLRDAPRVMEELRRAACELSLYRFLREAWPSFDPAPFVGGWHLEAIAEHLEAVTRGEIRKLLINIRPRSSKTSLVSI